MADDIGGDEAAWRDLITRLAAATADDEGPAPWPAREDLTATPPPLPGDPVMGPLTRPASPGLGAVPGGGIDPVPEARPPAAGPDRPVPGQGQVPARVVRAAAPSPDDEADDGHYVPPPPPPLPALGPVAKGAWAALFGGPGYLLLAVMAGWEVPGWAAFCAVAAFVGGFATLVVRMGDRPPRDSGPGNGAVV